MSALIYYYFTFVFESSCFALLKMTRNIFYYGKFYMNLLEIYLLIIFKIFCGIKFDLIKMRLEAHIAYAFDELVAQSSSTLFDF